MKKIILLCVSIILLSSTNLLNNPIVIPGAFISEFMFDENNNWILEMGFAYGTVYKAQDFDSICLASSAGIAKIRLDHIEEFDSFCVITTDSLSSSLSINRNGDCIKLYSYPSSLFPGEALIDSLIFGNYPGSQFDSLQIGYSISNLFGYIVCKDKSPTIGFHNDTTGTCGTLTGFMYDKYNELIIKGNFLLEHPFFVNNDGTFSTRTYARKTVITFIHAIIDTNRYRFLPIDSLSINIEPDSILNEDIHMLVDYSGVENKYPAAKSYQLTVMNYPNPFNAVTKFIIKMPASLTYHNGVIKIYNITGQEIVSIELPPNSTATWDGTDRNGHLQSSGIYYYQLILDDRLYNKGSLLYLK